MSTYLSLFHVLCPIQQQAHILPTFLLATDDVLVESPHGLHHKSRWACVHSDSVFIFLLGHLSLLPPLVFLPFFYLTLVWSLFSFIHAGFLPPFHDFMRGTDLGTNSKGGLLEQSGSPLLSSEHLPHLHFQIHVCTASWTR